MIRKSGHRFSEKDHAQTKKIERDDDSKKSHHALGAAPPASRSVSDRHRLPRGQAYLLVKCTQAISEATIIQTFRIQTLRGSIVCKTPDTFNKLRITRAYIKLLCIPEGDAKMVSLVQIGNYEI